MDTSAIQTNIESIENSYFPGMTRGYMVVNIRETNQQERTTNIIGYIVPRIDGLND